MSIPTSHKGAVFMARADRAERKAARREQRKVEKAERIACGEKGAPLDWAASTTVPPQQFPSAFDTSNPTVAGVGRTLSRGWR